MSYQEEFNFIPPILFFRYYSDYIFSSISHFRGQGYRGNQICTEINFYKRLPLAHYIH